MLRSLVGSEMCIRDRYSSDEDGALEELVFFICEAAGVDVTDLALDHDEKESTVAQMIERLRVDGVYPLSHKEAGKGKKIYTGFVQMQQHIVAECCAQDILFGDKFFEVVIQWLAVLSSSNARAIRHTATVASQATMVQIAKVLADLHTNVKKFEEMCDAEKDADNSAKLSQIEQNLATTQERAEHLESVLSWLFKTVYTNRYRDEVAVIRNDVISSIGDCIIACPAFFLEPVDAYLKYVGWTLSFRDGTTRVATLGTLVKLYQQPEIVTTVEQFTCLLYTSDAADEEDSGELGGRRIILKKRNADK
eukprot:TRINITY_DN52109_c0_g1_i1.p1 TRINITY_DN52109_c0_g1~~TRINITY_DN52109_c0_g1_i1.p1  ORF type:complete len:307 (-),score=95.87 TRINITY_DN52109_c0_g1_i1:61-981(-)